MAASHRVRLSQFQAGLQDYGIDMQIQSLLDNTYLERSFAGCRPSLRCMLTAYGKRFQALRQGVRFDLAIVYAELLPLLPAWLERQLLNIPYILDLDDAFYLKYRTGRFGLLRPLLGRKIDRLMAGAAAITVGNMHLATYAKRFNHRVSVLPSVVDTSLLWPRPSSPSPNPSDPYTVGWIGSPSTSPFLKLLAEPLQELARHRPVRLLVVGGQASSIGGVEVINLPWSLDREVSLIQQFDVGVMPLPDTPWARGKCAYKLIQCMACAVPVVASPVGANVDVVPPSCGFLAASSAEWLSAFRNLSDDPWLRARLGAAGRQRVETLYSLRSALPVLAGVIRHVAEETG